MKKTILVIAVSLLLAGFCFTPAFASQSTTVTSASSCGMTYTVGGGDNISKIAIRCGITVADILRLNPQVNDANLIYIGQVLRLTDSAPYSITQISPLTWFFNYYSRAQSDISGDSPETFIFSNYGYARVSLSTNEAEAGDKITIYVSGFPSNAQIDYRIGEWGEKYIDVYDGATNVDGNTSKTITIPNNADPGEYWVVLVTTTSEVNVVNVYSPTLYIIGDSANEKADVSLSASTVEAGKKITVYVSGFPVNADIDYRLGKKNEHYSVVYDGTIDSKGEASITITMPSDAVEGEHWIVQVVTTSHVNVVEAYSPVIVITD